MEAKGHDRMFTVLLLECIGTALFVWGIICTDTPVSIPFSLFASVVIFGDITGGHFNPAVTLGVFVQLEDMGKNILFCILIMLAQFIGGLAAIGLSWLGSFDIPQEKIAFISPTNFATKEPDNAEKSEDFQMYLAVIINEIVCTFLFVSVILMVKGKHTAGERKGVCAALCVVSTLLCVISGTNKLGACFNPAVGVGVTTYAVARIDTGDASNEYLWHYLWCYTVGPWIGALCAGLFHRIHRTFHEPEEHDHKAQGFSEEFTQRLTDD